LRDFDLERKEVREKSWRGEWKPGDHVYFPHPIFFNCIELLLGCVKVFFYFNFSYHGFVSHTMGELGS